MKILFLISTDGGNAAGGHFNSLHQVSLEMGANNDVKIIMLGKVLSPVLKDNPYLDRHFKCQYSILDLIRLRRKFKDYFKTFLPDVVHCFDTRALNLFNLCTILNKTPIVLNKCGGPNPLRNNYQHSDAVVVFSKENQKWYLESKYYQSDSIFLIPNRVRSLIWLDLNKRIEKSDPNKTTFVRISRLGGAYEMTLLQTFELLQRLSATNKVELFVIGRVSNKERFNNLVKIGDEKDFKITYITDGRASKGSNFLYLADFVIGTGRSLMEATSLGIPTLTPAKNTNIPILLNDDNIEQFLSTNFSERNIAPEYATEKTLNLLRQLITNKNKYNLHVDETKAMFNKYFGTDKINKEYTKVYNYVLSKEISKLNLIRKNLPYLLKFIIKGK